MKIVVYKDGSWKQVDSGITYEYENDPDWLCTIEPSIPAAEHGKKYRMKKSDLEFIIVLGGLFAVIAAIQLLIYLIGKH